MVWDTFKAHLCGQFVNAIKMVQDDYEAQTVKWEQNETAAAQALPFAASSSGVRFSELAHAHRELSLH